MSSPREIPDVLQTICGVTVVQRIPCCTAGLIDLKLLKAGEGLASSSTWSTTMFGRQVCGDVEDRVSPVSCLNDLEYPLTLELIDVRVCCPFACIVPFW